MSGISKDELRFALFSLTLRDKEKWWVNSLKHGEVTTCKELIENFMKKFFLPIKNARKRQELMLFKQRDRENLHDAWSRFK